MPCYFLRLGGCGSGLRSLFFSLLGAHVVASSAPLLCLSVALFLLFFPCFPNFLGCFVFCPDRLSCLGFSHHRDTCRLIFSARAELFYLLIWLMPLGGLVIFVCVCLFYVFSRSGGAQFPGDERAIMASSLTDEELFVHLLPTVRLGFLLSYVFLCGFTFLVCSLFHCM